MTDNNVFESDGLTPTFLANMSHEVRTPLNGILGLAQIMLKSTDIEPRIRNDIKTIIDSGNSLLSLFENIMDVLKIETGQMKINGKPFYLKTMTDRIFSMFLVDTVYRQKNAEQQNVVLKYDQPDENIAIISDHERLKKILAILISNALKFTEKGFVRFGYTIQNQEITFYVKDSGIGIPKGQTEKIFDIFSQVGSASGRNSSGIGLGLTIAKGLITLLNGKIWCESELGKGSNFYFTIPFRPTNMLNFADIPMNEHLMDKDWSDYTALLVEDDPISSKVIKAMLRNTKINLILADNGLKAVEQVRLNPKIDLALMDMQMPKMNGLEATGKILNINPDIPIIAQTANGAKTECLEAGCVDYIKKPIRIGELFTKMSKFLPDKAMVAYSN